MRFEWPSVFLVLLAVPLFFRHWLAKLEPPTLRWPSLGLWNQNASLGKKTPWGPHGWLLFMRILAGACWIVALARPQLSDERSYRTVSGVDLLLAIDVSRSMQARDLGEFNRLDTAKQNIKRFIEGRPNDRMGLVMFAGEAYTLSPPTLDAGLLFQALSEVQMGVLRDGTAIGDGLALSINRLRASKAKSRVIVLLTDGDNNAGQIDPLTAGELAVGYGIRVYTIAVGREGKVAVPIEVEDALGRKHTQMQVLDNALNTTLLEQIAEKTQGKFYRVGDREALSRVFSEIDRLEKSELKTHTQVHYRDVFVLWIWLGLWIWVASEVLRWGVWKLTW